MDERTDKKKWVKEMSEMLAGLGKSVSADVAKSEHADTVDDMPSDDHRERLRAEYRQLTTRLDRLEAMLARMDAGTLDFEPTCPRELLGRQASAMSDYACILRERAAFEGVELNDRGRTKRATAGLALELP